MGAAQYLRDFRRSHNLKKTAELRKRVLQRQEKRKEQSDSVPYKVYIYISKVIIFYENNEEIQSSFLTAGGMRGGGSQRGGSIKSDTDFLTIIQSLFANDKQ